MPHFDGSAARAKRLRKLGSAQAHDFDPEDDFQAQRDTDENGSDSLSDDGSADERARDHYIDVGQSKLRRNDEVAIGPQYDGSRISRRQAVEALDKNNHDPFADHSDAEGDAVFSTQAQDDSMGGSEEVEEYSSYDEDDESVMEDHNTNSSTSSPSQQQDEEDAQQPSRDDLKRLMTASQSTLSASLAAATAADAAKGNAVLRQRAAFNALLNTRIRLQQALISSNTLSLATRPPPPSDDPAVTRAVAAAQSLWASLASLRDSLPQHAGTKRKHPDPSTSSASELWSAMQAHEAAALPHRRAVLAKWSGRTAAAAAATAATSSKLNNTASASSTAAATNSSSSNILAALDAQLADPQRLVDRSRIPRSCAPVHAARLAQRERESRGNHHHPSPSTPDPSNNPNEDQIYDDAPLYAILLKDLLSSHQTSLNNFSHTIPDQISSQLAAARAAKQHRNGGIVDTRASKGRKLRYTTHEKLVNFMAPEDRAVWGERQREEFFRGLFGKIHIKSSSNRDGEVEGNGDREGEEEEEREEGALRLFRN